MTRGSLENVGYGRPLFVPLATEPFRAFESGVKTVELRRSSKRWSERHVWRGRPVLLRRGYSTKEEIAGFVGRVAVATDWWALPEWAQKGGAVAPERLVDDNPFFNPHAPLIAFEVVPR